MTATRLKWMGLKVPGDTMVFWWPAGTDPDTYDADHSRAMDMAVVRYTELYGEAPEAEIIGKLAMVSDLEDDELGCAARHGSGTSGTDRLPGRGAV